MPRGLIKSNEDEKKWERAKKLADEQGHGQDWPYVMSIFKNLKGEKDAGKLNKAAFLLGYLS